MKRIGYSLVLFVVCALLYCSSNVCAQPYIFTNGNDYELAKSVGAEPFRKISGNVTTYFENGDLRKAENSIVIDFAGALIASWVAMV